MMTATKVEFCPNPEYMVFHTKFNLQEHPGLKIIIDSITGVEKDYCFMDWHNRYQFSVRVGSMFDRQEVATAIQQKINEYFGL